MPTSRTRTRDPNSVESAAVRATQQSSSARLRSLLAALPDLVFRMSSDGEYLEAHGHPTAFVVPPESFIGRHASEVLPPALAQQSLEANRRALETGETVRFEYELAGGVFEARVAPCGDNEVMAIVRDLGPQRSAERQLQREHAFFTQMAAAMGQGLIVTDANARLVYANPAYAALVGEDASRLVGTPMQERVHRDDRDALGRLRLEHERERVAQGNIRLKRADGGWADALLTCVPRRTESGDEGAVVVVTDLSERVRFERTLERERDFSHAITEDAEFIVIVTDASGRVTRLNPCAARTLETTEAEARGRSLWALFADPRASCLVRRALQLAPLGRSRTPSQLSWVDSSGEPRFASVSYAKLCDSDGILAHVVVTGIDTTALRRAEATTEQASRARAEFLRYVTHELRTPLHAISGFCELLLDPGVGALNADQTDFALEIKRASDHLFSLISDLLDLSKINAGSVKLEPRIVEVAPLLRDAVALLEGAATQAGVALSFEVGSGVDVLFGGERQIRQVLVNLLSNAVKFTPRGGAVRLTSSLDDGWLRLSVRDTGIGMLEEDLARIFEPFAQAKNSPSHLRSFGLGLTLAKRLAELHGGRLEVSSRIGEGSEFSLVLPRDGSSVNGA
jgi:PAS domain S-box-containing protein